MIRALTGQPEQVRGSLHDPRCIRAVALWLYLWVVYGTREKMAVKLMIS